MRILAIANWFPPHHRGGYEINCADVMTRMASRGHDVEVLCSDERLPGVREDTLDSATSIPVHRYIRLYWRDEVPWKPPVHERLRIERANQASLRRVLDRFEPDVISVWHMAVMSLSLLATIGRRDLPVVYAICDSWPTYALQLDHWSRLFNGSALRRVVGHVCERVISTPCLLPDLGSLGHASFVSSFTWQEVQAGSPWRFQQHGIIASGIDRSNLKTDTTDGDAAPDRPWDWRLGYFGRFDPRKGTETLIRGFALLPERSSLVMYGRGGEGERERLRALADSLGVGARVSFGFLDSSELGEAYRALDCVVFPSEWPEPFGLVPLEAMECGVPVVATGVGGSADITVDGVNAVLFRAGDPASLAEAVRRLAHDPVLRAQLVERGRHTVERYDVDLMADAYERRFEDEIRCRGRDREHQPR
ncbi:MAG TPA: glycosyltransferase family 4 protein [Acidimicrobiales bacterium]|nr:glycosyltransferase family 4 protein [Acidimicrobiales bacterium]